MSILRKSDSEWKAMGERDPYYGVVTLDRFRGGNLDEAALKEFFDSGEEHIRFIFETIRSRLDKDFSPKRALDFGCGVGRCTIPIAARCAHVVGADVSEAMLREAAKNCAGKSVSNAEFVLSDDALSRVEGPLDFAHSFITFQHIPPARGERIFERQVELLSEGGVGVHQFVYHRDVPAAVKFAGSLRKVVPGFHNLLNILSGKPAREPLVEKNRYDLNRLFRILHGHGCGRVFTLFEGESALRSAVVFFQKKKEPLPYEAFYNRRRTDEDKAGNRGP